MLKTRATFIVILVTAPSRRDAGRIADTLLKKRLVACANIIGGVQSKFWWRGNLDNAREALLILKTTAGNFARVEKEVRRLHSYDVPEIIAVPIVAGSKSYLEWLGDSVGRD